MAREILITTSFNKFENVLRDPYTWLAGLTGTLPKVPGRPSERDQILGNFDKTLGNSSDKLLVLKGNDRHKLP